MTVFPFDIDSDADIIRIDDNITEQGGEAINQLRDAVFAIETEFGTTPSGSKTTVSSRLDTSLNADGSIKASALTSVGLATLPIANNQVATTAGIQEFKLALDHTTSDLFTLITSNSVLLTALTTFANATDADLGTHVGGGALLSDGSAGRHVASHIDLNDVPSDIRDPSFVWAGLLDKAGAVRTATHVAGGLLQVNDDFVAHQNAINGAHVATAISLDTSNFQVVPLSITDVQQFADYVDDIAVIELGRHRATQHANAVPLIARSQGLSLPDGYGWQNVVPPTAASTFLVRNPNTMPVDDISNGDDIVKFNATNTSFVFDSQFVNVKTGDIIRINYGNGSSASYPIESVRHIPGSEWLVRINGTNLADSDGYAFARIDRPQADRETSGVLAVAAANATPTGSFNSILQSVIVGHPRGASALGLGFDPGQLDASHYKLYLEMYPTGSPSGRVISLPAIDVTGDAGISPGQYTLDSVIQATNNGLREIGFNYRFIAYGHKGDFGIMMADAINNASFAIISGSNSTGTLVESTFTDNVIGDAVDDLDALGLGQTHADVASPAFVSTFTDATAALLPTKVIVPRKNRHYVVDGVQAEGFGDTWLANSSGYWDGYISARVPVGAFSVETTYSVLLDLKPAGLKPGKTIVIQPSVAFTDGLYNDVDYGRFIIKSVSFAKACPGEAALTLITVINGIHATGVGFGTSGVPNLAVRLHFSEDSVSFNNQNIIDTSPSSVDYHRLHEIFISNEKRTFSHERARMVIQAEATPLLSSANFHIKNVSSKLRGYRDTVTTFNRYIRFYILNYDTTTGEFDGYIGQRSASSANISKVGSVVTGRKAVTTRFYDETNIDYIDLIFVENAVTSPGTGILSDGIAGGGGTARYVDIELFPSMQTDDEMLLLATAEVNWDPQSGQDVVDRVTDRRQLGSIDEEDFTTSAIEFISAGDRFLHDNGILRGLDFDFINPTDNREIFYKGGSALVNGKVVNVNNSSVTIPEIHENGTAPPTTEDWAVCVNEDGFLEPILITASKQQFFAKDNNSSNTYYVPSVTFTELVASRKDLSVIAVVTTAIASTTITDSDVDDVRRLITDIGLNIDLTATADGYVGSGFPTFGAAVNWIKRFSGGGKEIIRIKGEHNITTTVDLSSITGSVIFEGENGILNITASKGIIPGDNVSFKNITFVYNPTGITFTAGDTINNGNGCVYHAAGSDLNNLKFKDCYFSSSAATQRPPFINIELDNADVLESFEVSDSTFDDPSGDGYQAAVAIVGSNTGAASLPAVVSNMIIARNKTVQRQGFYLVSTVVSGTGVLHTPGVSCLNSAIENNSCGVIGFLITSEYNDVNIVGVDRTLSGITIRGNTAHVIATTSDVGDVLIAGSTDAADFTYGMGNIVCENNIANWIHIINTDVGTDQKGSTIVRGNRLRAYDTAYLNGVFGTTTLNTAITVDCRTITDVSACIVADNTIDGYGLTNDLLYGTGIAVHCSANIHNNIINGFTSTGLGLFSGALGTDRNYVVTGNRILREVRSITAYIFGFSQDVAHITDNFFDSPTVDGSSTSLTLFNGAQWVYTRNHNQTEFVYIMNQQGEWYDGGTGRLKASLDITNLDIDVGYANIGNTHTNLTATAAVSSSAPNWMVSLENIIPFQAHVVAVTLNADRLSSNITAGTASLTLSTGGAGGTTEVGTPTWDFSSQAIGIPVTTTITTPDKTYKTGTGLAMNLAITGFITSSTGTLNFSPCIITYRW